MDTAHKKLCVIETPKPIWDLGGTMDVEFTSLTHPEAPGFMVHEGDHLRVTVTVKLTGHIRHYLCETWLCVCLGFESCGPGPEDEFCDWIRLVGEHSPCRTDTYTFNFDLPNHKLTAGPCGREYDICITLGSKDCCRKVGFIFGRCREFTLTVLPKIEDGDNPPPVASSATETPAAAVGTAPAEAAE